MSDLRERCTIMLSTLKQNAILRQGSPVDDLMAFVMGERGREAFEEPVSPLVLYFANEVDRAEFIAIWKDVHPNTISRTLP